MYYTQVQARLTLRAKLLNRLAHTIYAVCERSALDIAEQVRSDTGSSQPQCLFALHCMRVREMEVDGHESLVLFFLGFLCDFKETPR